KAGLCNLEEKTVAVEVGCGHVREKVFEPTGQIRLLKPPELVGESLKLGLYFAYPRRLGVHGDTVVEPKQSVRRFLSEGRVWHVEVGEFGVDTGHRLVVEVYGHLAEEKSVLFPR